MLHFTVTSTEINHFADLVVLMAYRWLTTSPTWKLFVWVCFFFRQHQKADRWTPADKIEPDQQVSEKQTIMGAHIQLTYFSGRRYNYWTVCVAGTGQTLLMLALCFCHGWRLLICHSQLNSVRLIIFSLIIFPWQLIAFSTLIIQEDRPNSTHAYATIKEECADVWQLRSTQDHSATLSCCQRKQKESASVLISPAARWGRESGEERQWNSLIPPICQSKLLLFLNQTEHKQTQSCANESKWDVTVLLGLIY